MDSSTLDLHRDFQYVVQRQGKAKISFGTSQERDVCCVTSRFGIEFTPNPLPNSAPGKYFVASSLIQRKPESTKGTVLGGRTKSRETHQTNADYPTSVTYQIKDRPLTPAYTFSKGIPRFKEWKKHCTVGPGFYNIRSPLQRKPKFLHSFGGKRWLVPAIEMKCGPFNPDTCEKCKKSPKGDYWNLVEQVLTNDPNLETRNLYLCRTCYSIEKKEPSMFTKAKLMVFKKVRDCSQVHFHDGCEARLLLVPPRDIEKIQEKEAYLSLYFE